MKDKYRKIAISKDVSVIDALRQMDSQKRKLLLVLDNEKFLSLLSIGDVQRAIIANASMDSSISTILRDSVRVARVGDNREDIINHMREKRNDFMPIIDDNNNIKDIIFWEDLFPEDDHKKPSRLNLPVIIMAGGKGTRLQPLTNVLPKPLIPIGDQTMMEDIMDRFVEHGCNDFYISVNYKAELIKQYMNLADNSNYNISYFQEDKPQGTAGSLHLLKGKINSTFFVSNCDIIVDEDYAEILKYHKENKNEITVVAAVKTYSIPYGTLETGNNGTLQSLQEKPDLTFKINTGMYILEPHLIDEIPEDKVFHITHLMENLINEGRQVGVFPISEGSWIDVGNWNEYMQFIK